MPFCEDRIFSGIREGEHRLNLVLGFVFVPSVEQARRQHTLVQIVAPGIVEIALKCSYIKCDIAVVR